MASDGTGSLEEGARPSMPRWEGIGMSSPSELAWFELPQQPSPASWQVLLAGQVSGNGENWAEEEIWEVLLSFSFDPGEDLHQLCQTLLLKGCDKLRELK